jgi:hypothetical protein
VNTGVAVPAPLKFCNIKAGAKECITFSSLSNLLFREAGISDVLVECLNATVDQLAGSIGQAGLAGQLFVTRGPVLIGAVAGRGFTLISPPEPS